MRIPGFAGKVMAEIGVNVVNIPGGELYTALDRGTIDALEWVGPGLDIKMGFHKVAPFYYSGWHEPSGETQFLINKAAFNKLSNKYQTMLVTAMKAVSEDMSIENFAENISAWEKITNDNRNIQIKVFPKPVLREMKRATDRVMQRYADKNELFKEIWNDYSSYMIKARKWTTMGVGNYLKSAEEVGAGVER
jgi:TRAP-type mannitol/chloroaromatic compound transport system substrate-binding protein